MAAPQQQRPPMQVRPPIQGGDKGGSERGMGIAVFLTVLYIIYIAAFIIGPLYGGDYLGEELEERFPPLFRLIGSGLLFVLFAAIIFFSLAKRGRGQSRPATGPQRQPLGTSAANSAPAAGGKEKAPFSSEERTFKPVTIGADPLKEGKKAEKKKEKRIITYPKWTEGGIYGATYIDLGQEKTLKLRSLIMEPKYLK